MERKRRESEVVKGKRGIRKSKGGKKEEQSPENINKENTKEDKDQFRVEIYRGEKNRISAAG